MVITYVLVEFCNEIMYNTDSYYYTLEDYNMAIPEEQDKSYKPNQNVPEIAELNEYRRVYESVENGGSKPIDISLMTGSPAPTNSNKKYGGD